MESKINQIKRMNQPIIVCCASGRRDTATANKKNSGIEIYPARVWHNLTF